MILQPKVTATKNVTTALTTNSHEQHELLTKKETLERLPGL